MSTLIVPPEFAADFADREGAEGKAWVESLPELGAKYLDRWQLTTDGEAMHGFVSIVQPVRRADGTTAVLKIGWPHEEAEHEALALSTWDGQGAVRLLEHDGADWAMLLEHLDQSRPLTALPIDDAVTVAGELIRRLDVPAPAGMRRLSDVAATWVEELAEDNAEEGSPVPHAMIDLAVGFCAELGPAAGDRLVNEDLHYDNVLAGAREPWLVIDPKPLVGDLEFGLIPLLWNRPEDGEPLDRLLRLVETAGLDRELARRWTFVRAVDNWLWSSEIADPDPASARTCASIAGAMLG